MNRNIEVLRGEKIYHGAFYFDTIVIADYYHQNHITGDKKLIRLECMFTLSGELPDYMEKKNRQSSCSYIADSGREWAYRINIPAREHGITDEEFIDSVSGRLVSTIEEVEECNRKSYESDVFDEFDY